jgi:acyl-CoA synthetase (AMP-forming)/AMP-acid ligase II
LTWAQVRRRALLVAKIGEIWVYGDNVARGYWRNPELSEKTFGKTPVDPSPSADRHRKQDFSRLDVRV